MDESRPGHTPRLPLIIDRPDLAHPLRRIAGLLLTVLAWLFWLAMWIPFALAIGRYFGYDLPVIIFPSHINLDSFLALVQVAPFAIAIAFLAIVVAWVIERLRKHWGTANERWRPVGMDRLARDAALDPQRVAEWQHTQILYVEHGPLGRVSNAHASRPEPDRP